MRASAGLDAGWTSLAENEMQGFSLGSSRAGKSHELQIPRTLGRGTWAKWTLPLGLFAGLASLWVVFLWDEHHIGSLPSATAAPPALAAAADVRIVACAAVVCVAGSADELP